MEDIGPRIREEQTRIEKIHPLEAKRNCDAIDRALQNIEEMARSVFRDIQMLQEGKFATSDQLFRRFVAMQYCQCVLMNMFLWIFGIASESFKSGFDI